MLNTRMVEKLAAGFHSTIALPPYIASYTNIQSFSSVSLADRRTDRKFVVRDVNNSIRDEVNFHNSNNSYCPLISSKCFSLWQFSTSSIRSASADDEVQNHTHQR